MVVPFTDPGWTPLFSLAAGVVTETGGLLSHAALISREYGIPCVLNVNGATDVIPDGVSIEIDGMEGRVTLL
jgi:pyruvate,water dikinase